MKGYKLMTNLNLWENLNPISLSELKEENNYDASFSKLLKNVITKEIKVSEYINLNPNQIQDIRKLHLNLYKLLSLPKYKEDLFINNLPSNEREVINKFKEIKGNLTLISEAQHIKTQIELFGKSKFYEDLSKGF